MQYNAISLVATSKLVAKLCKALSLKQCLLVASIKERLGKFEHINVTFIGPHLGEVMQASSSARENSNAKTENQLITKVKNKIRGIHKTVAYMFLK